VENRLLKFSPENQAYAKELRDAKTKKPSTNPSAAIKDKDIGGAGAASGARRKEATTSRKRGREDVGLNRLIVSDRHLQG
jgi:hypothetical protein